MNRTTQPTKSSRRPADQRGATAVIIALTMTLICCAVAFAIDITNLTRVKWELQHTLDAAAHAGASKLPANAAGAEADAKAFAAANGFAGTPTVEFFCVVASTGATRQIATGQIPATCNPGTTTGFVCNDNICSIPCPKTATCNTMRVSASDTVPYYFAPLMGFNQGNTGAITSVACKGSCGTVVPNAMDVVVVADRTPSMSSGDLTSMKNGILGMYQTMTPELQSVALGAIHRASYTGAYESSYYKDQGPWVATDYSNRYLNAGVAGSRTLNYSNQLVDVTKNLALTDAYAGNNFGTNLAAAMRGAYSSLAARPNTDASRGGAVKKVIIFETDGMPDETLPLQTDVRRADPSGGNQLVIPYYRQTATQKQTGGPKGCALLEQVAALAKSDGMLVVTIAFGQANTAGCNISSRSTTPYSTDGPSVKVTLANSASPKADGTASTAGDCGTTSGAATENADGDFFFCAANASQLAPMFTSVINQVSNSIRLMQLP